MDEPSGSERVQRVRIGLTGLAFVFLLVLLGHRDQPVGRSAAAGPTLANGLANGVEPDEPLAADRRRAGPVDDRERGQAARRATP